MGRSIFSNWVGLLTTGLVGIVLTPMLIHHLGWTYYGLWIVVSSLLDYSGLLDNGIRVAMFRFVARYYGAQNRDELNRILTTSLALTIAVGGLLLALLPALVTYLPRFFGVGAHDATVFRYTMALVGGSFAIAFPARALGSYMSGVGRFDLYNAGAVSTAVLRGAAIAVALLRGYGLIAVAAITLASTVYSLGINALLMRFADREAQLAWSSVSWRGIRELLDYGVYAFVYNCGDQLRSYTDSIVIGRVLLVSLIPLFNIATRLTEYCKQFFTAAAGPSLGRLTELDGRGDMPTLRRYFLQLTRFYWLAGLFVGAMLYMDGKAVIVTWVGPAFLPSYTLLAILIAGWTIEYGWAPSQMILLAQARHRFLAFLVIAEGASNLVLSIYWAHKYGLVGVAIGTAVPMLVTKLLIQPWYVFHVVGVTAWQYVRDALARSTLAAAIWLALCLLPGVPRASEGLLHLALATATQAGLFVLVAPLVALTSTERRALLARATNLLGAMRPAGAWSR